MWDHVADAHGGQGREEPHQDFTFYLTGSFIKPLERQVDEMRRLDRVEREGRTTIMVKGKVKEIKTSMESLNRKEERYNLGGGRVRASFGQPKGNQRPPAPAPPAPPAPPPPPPYCSACNTSSSPYSLTTLSPTNSATLPSTTSRQEEGQ